MNREELENMVIGRVHEISEGYLKQIIQHLSAKDLTKPTSNVQYSALGYQFCKNSSGDCSPMQRVVFLGTKGSKLLELSSNRTFENTKYDRGCLTKDGAYVFTSSVRNTCTAQPEDEYDEGYPLSKILRGLSESVGAPVGITGLSPLSKDLKSRNNELFSKLPITAEGAFAFVPPYYPNVESTPYHLPAIPWQKYLYTLQADRFYRTGIELVESQQYLRLQNHAQLALLPLNTNER